MTDARKARRGSPGAMAVVVLTLGGFLILLSILSLQMRAGHDPALGSTATAEQPRVILKRRIVDDAHHHHRRAHAGGRVALVRSGRGRPGRRFRTGSRPDGCAGPGSAGAGSAGRAPTSGAGHEDVMTRRPRVRLELSLHGKRDASS